MSEQNETVTSESGETTGHHTLVKVFGGFLVAGIVLYLFGRVLGWQKILSTLSRANLLWVGAACLSSTVGLVVWSKSWDVILTLLDVEIPHADIVPTYFAATFADYVTPFSRAGGGPLIAYVLSTDDRASYEASLASVVTADLLNLLPFFTFAVVGAVFLGVQGHLPPGTRSLILGLTAVAVVVPVGGYLVWRRRTLVERVATAVVSPIAAHTDWVDAADVRERIREFYARVEVIGAHPRVLARTLVYSYVGWVFFALPLYLAAHALGLPLAAGIVLFVVPASTIAGLVPTPGGLGGVEVALVGLLVALTPLGPEAAAATALLYRVASYWYVLLVGGAAALYEIYG